MEVVDLWNIFFIKNGLLPAYIQVGPFEPNSLSKNQNAVTCWHIKPENGFDSPLPTKERNGMLK